MKLNELYWREKNQNFKIKCYAYKENKYQTIFNFLLICAD